jgi:hypothetical protein
MNLVILITSGPQRSGVTGPLVTAKGLTILKASRTPKLERANGRRLSNWRKHTSA